MKILDGQKLAETIYTRVKNKVSKMKQKPVLAVILVGNDPASMLYVKIKKRKCEEVGIGIKISNFKFQISNKIKIQELQNKIINQIKKYNKDKNINGIIVQLPLPKSLDTEEIISSIDPKKDVDGLHPENVKLLAQAKPNFVPPTAAGIMELMRANKIKLKNKNIVLVGHGKLVGKPLADLIMINYPDEKLTICDRETQNLSEITKKADILISATGQAHLIKADMVKHGAVVIDAGTSVEKARSTKSEIRKKFRNSKFEIRNLSKVVGDVDFEEVKEIASYITPPKGGVGPMTVAKLLENVINTK